MMSRLTLWVLLVIDLMFLLANLWYFHVDGKTINLISAGVSFVGYTVMVGTLASLYFREAVSREIQKFPGQ
jgi:hypothetical protein